MAHDAFGYLVLLDYIFITRDAYAPYAPCMPIRHWAPYKIKQNKNKKDRSAEVSIVTMAPGRAVATAGINSNVDVCEKAKHHTELFW